jgi:hypothetical protein
VSADLCRDCRAIISDWLRQIAFEFEESDPGDDDLQLSCPIDGRRTWRVSEVSA